MTPVGSVVRDLRALGSSAPLRAAYEGSKRSGFHSVLFRERRRGVAHRSTSIGVGAEIPSSPAARRRCLDDAALILSEGTRVFGRRVPTGVHAPWNFDPLTGRQWPQRVKWWRIDIRTEERISDVKWVWEAARHRDFVVLARASVLEPGGPWLGELEAALQSWVDQCPPERGVNWYSSLELALRAIAWAQVLQLVGDRLDPGLRGELDAQLVASARHIVVELPYTLSSMKNNHLLGDGLGLVVLGRLFPGHPASRRWRRLGDAIFLKQLARHMRPDGSMIEDSLSYHRFVLEMLVVRVLLGDSDPRVRNALGDASQHLRRLGALDGDVPQYGDWDEGRVLADSAPAGSVAGSALIGLALTGNPVDPALWGAHDELAWYVAPPAQQPAADPLPPLRVTGDFHIVERGPWRVWFKVSGGPSHQHADLSSVWIQNDNAWVVREPGTGTYNGPLDVRNGFRTSDAHPVWHPEGVDQLVPHRAFRWLRAANGYAAAPRQIDDLTLLFAWHDAFESEPVPSRVARAVLVGDASVTIVDFIESPGGRDWTLTVPLGAPASVPRFGLEQAVERKASEHPFAGWHSPTYGSWEPASWLRGRTRDHVTVWGMGEQPVVRRAGSETHVNECSFSLTWAEDAAVLSFAGPAYQEEVEVLRG